MTSALKPSAPAPAAVPGADAQKPASEKAIRLHHALDRLERPDRVNWPLVAAGSAAWIVFALITQFVPNNIELPMSETGAIDRATPFTLTAAIVLAVVWPVLALLAGSQTRASQWALRQVSHGSAWFLGAAVWFIVWQLLTSKTSIAAPPYYAAPQIIFDNLWNDRILLLGSLYNSVQLLAIGFIVGLIVGLATGLTIGWFQVANYWVHPVLMFIGPLPALAIVPIVYVIFPNAYAGAVFMIALSVWFPISVLTRAGILSVPRSYFDVAQTLGAKNPYLVLRVSLPAALPSIFTGAFMALGSAFSSLVVAENFGVNSGIGWYLSWKKGWGDYGGVYAGVVVLILVCTLTLLLHSRLRGWVLRWEKELTRW